jgi:hypothetical protein
MKLYSGMSNKKHARLDLLLLVMLAIMGLMATLLFLGLPQMANSGVEESNPMSLWVGVVAALICYAFYGVTVIGTLCHHEHDNKLLIRYAYGWPVMGFIAWYNGPEPIPAKVT